MSDARRAAGPPDAFEEHRPALLGAVYRIIGSRTDAQDVLQEVWIRWQRVDQATVAEPRAFLFRLATNAAIDALRRSTARREEYIGPWLPEPIALDPAPDDASNRAASLSMGVLVLLESLTPVERAVFVLHEAFGFAYDEIADVVDRTEHAVRQLAYRARRHVAEGRSRFEATPTVTPRTRVDRREPSAAGRMVRHRTAPAWG